MTAAAARKRVELERKIAGVREELDRWREQSGTGKPLRIHHSQIARVAAVLEALATTVEERLARLRSDERLLARASDIEVMVLELHRIWQFFRVKLALRYVAWFRDHLLAVDELAWACYAPVQDCVPKELLPPGGRREPPLTFLNGGSSPFRLARGSRYTAEEVPGEALGTNAIARALQDLPIALVGVPWHQLQHLPDALVVAHEVGHIVEEELGLAEALQDTCDAALAGAADDHRVAWRAWLGEAFADIFGTLATGPAFVATLIDFLAADRATLADDVQGPLWSEYPSRALRVGLCIDTLRARGFYDEADGLGARWRDIAGPTHAPAVLDEAGAVAAGILGTAYAQLGHRRLGDVVGLTAEQHDLAGTTATRVLGHEKVTSSDTRVLLAAARIAFDRDPVGFGTGDVQAKLLARIVAAQRNGVRAQRGTRDVRAHATADAKLGRDLAQRILPSDPELDPEEPHVQARHDRPPRSPLP